MAWWTKQWADPQWRADVDEWIDATIEEFEVSRTEPTQWGRTRLWSTQATIPTDAGQLWFKAPCPGLSAEGNITGFFNSIDEQRFAFPLNVNMETGWFLLPDYGDNLKTLPSPFPDLWALMLQDFGRAQVELVGRDDEVFDHGMPILDPAWIMTHLEQQLILHAALPADHPLHIPAETAEQLDQSFQPLHQDAALLHSAGIPLSLDHNDLHRGNVMLPLEEGDPLRFMDLADSYWAHPFGTLSVPVRWMCDEFSCEPDDERITKVIHTYLEQWSDYGTVDELSELVAPAIRLSGIAHHGVWLRILDDADEQDMRDYGNVPIDILKNLTQPLRPKQA